MVVLVHFYNHASLNTLHIEFQLNYMCVSERKRAREREKETVMKHTAGSFRFLQTGTTVGPLLLSSPPLLSTHPSFQTQQHHEQSPFIPPPHPLPFSISPESVLSFQL